MEGTPRKRPAAALRPSPNPRGFPQSLPVTWAEAGGPRGVQLWATAWSPGARSTHFVTELELPQPQHSMDARSLLLGVQGTPCHLPFFL